MNEKHSGAPAVSAAIPLDPPAGAEIAWCARHPKTAGEWIAKHRDALRDMTAKHDEVLALWRRARADNVTLRAALIEKGVEDYVEAKGKR